MGVKAIAQALKLVPSTCLHILRALVSEQLVKVDPATKHYSLGTGMLPLARAVLANSDFATVVQPRLDDLSKRYGMTAIGVDVPSLDHMIVVTLSRTQAPVRLHVDVGSRFPALISATGRCIAAYGGYPDAEIEARFKTLRWDEPPSFADWRAQVEATRLQGFAVDPGNYISGVTVVAAPVWKTRDRPSHALVAIGLGSALKRNGLPALQDALKSGARILSNQLCGEMSPELSAAEAG